MMKVWQPSIAEIEETKNWGVWTKEKSTFPWNYDSVETCYILEGEAIVSDNNGNEIRFKEGQMVQFSEGLSCKWTILRDIKKKYIFS